MTKHTLFVAVALFLGSMLAAETAAKPSPPILIGTPSNIPARIAGDYPAYWEALPASPQARASQAGKDCSSSDVACVTSCNAIASAVQNPAIRYVLIAGEADGGPRDGIYSCTPPGGARHGAFFTNTVPNQLIGPRNDAAVWVRGGEAPSDWNGATTIGPTGGARNQYGFILRGAGTEVHRLQLGPIERGAIIHAANRTKAYGNFVWGSWTDGAIITGRSGAAEPGETVDDTVTMGNVCVNARHSSCFTVHIGGGTPNYTAENWTIKQNACLFAGYDTDGKKVPSIGGDNPSVPQGFTKPPSGTAGAGGGNSDCVATANKYCDDGDGPDHCKGGQVYDNFSYQSTDDGMDLTLQQGKVLRNVLAKAQPEGNRGIKVFNSRSRDYVAAANIILGGSSPTPLWVGGPSARMGVGIEYRQIDGGTSYSRNNTVVGMSGKALNSAARGTLSFGNELSLANHSDGSYPASWNTARGSSGVSSNCSTGLADGLNYSNLLNASAWLDDPIGALWGVISQVHDACKPQAGSPLIDAGVFDTAVHCPVADDDPSISPAQARDPSCVHWCGSAPDIGAIEVCN